MRFKESAGLLASRALEHGYAGGRPVPRRRVAILAVLASAHIAVFLLWQQQPYEPASAKSASVSSLVFINLPVPQAVHRKSIDAITASPAALLARRGPKRAMPTATVVPMPAPAPALAPAPASPVEEAPEVANLLDRARASARRLAPETVPATKATPALTLEQSLGTAIAAAARPRTTTIEELQTADGRPLSKISGPGGTYCVTRDGFGPSAGRDPFRDGARDRVVRCPR